MCCPAWKRKWRRFVVVLTFIPRFIPAMIIHAKKSGNDQSSLWKKMESFTENLMSFLLLRNQIPLSKYSKSSQLPTRGTCIQNGSSATIKANQSTICFSSLRCAIPNFRHTMAGHTATPNKHSDTAKGNDLRQKLSQDTTNGNCKVFQHTQTPMHACFFSVRTPALGSCLQGHDSHLVMFYDETLC